MKYYWIIENDLGEGIAVIESSVRDLTPEELDLLDYQRWTAVNIWEPEPAGKFFDYIAALKKSDESNEL